VVNHVEATWRIAPPAGCDLSQYLLYRRHLFAYEAACRKAGSWRTVVDIACGLGYALPMLARDGAQVLAVDLAEAPLRSLPDAPHVHRVQANAAQLPLASGSVDLLVAFQLLEHVPYEVGLRILAETRRVLAPGGYGFLTTPNASWRLLPGQRPWNPFHVLEYRPGQIERLCREAGLPRCCLYGVIGLAGAQEVELERVRPFPGQFSEPGLGSRLRRIWACLRGTSARMRTRLRGGLPLPPHAEVRPEYEAADWFTLTPRYRQGLDFWIEVRG
jgi:SAM-dependent methyltransferase